MVTLSSQPVVVIGAGLAGLAIGVLPIVILAIAIAATAGLQWLFNATALGRSFRAVSDDREIAELMGLDARKVAIERNLEIVPRSTYAATMLDEGDRLEIVNFVGGG